MILRTCATDAFKNVEKDIVRTSHCGFLSLKNFDGLNDVNTSFMFRGCLSTCHYDACNKANLKNLSNLFVILILFINKILL